MILSALGELMEYQRGYLADHPEALDMVTEWAYVEWFAASGCSREETRDEYRARCHKDQLPLTLLAWQSPELIGMVSLIYDHGPESDAELPCLGGLYVVPERRHRGIGRRLCDWAVDEAVRLGIAKLTLFTHEHAEFYRQLGWTGERLVGAEMAGSWRLVHMLERMVPT